MPAYHRPRNPTLTPRLGPRFASQYPFRNPWAPIYHYRWPYRDPRYAPSSRFSPVYHGRGHSGWTSWV